MKTIESCHHKATLSAGMSVIVAQIYPAAVDIKKATPLLMLSVPSTNPIADSLITRAVKVLLDDLDEQVEKAEAS